MANGDFIFQVGEGADGTFIACRETEPVFCFHRQTQDEAVVAARAAIEDYIARFKPALKASGIIELDQIPAWQIESQRAYRLEVE